MLELSQKMDFLPDTEEGLTWFGCEVLWCVYDKLEGDNNPSKAEWKKRQKQEEEAETGKLIMFCSQ